MLLIEYPTCSTCRKAKKALIEKGYHFEVRHIVEQCPSEAELRLWMTQSALPISRFFNTSGKLYRELHLKEKIQDLTQEEAIHLLSQHPMLIKRPLLIDDTMVIVGYDRTFYEKK